MSSPDFHGSKGPRGIVFSLDALFAVILMGIAVLTFASLFSFTPLTLSLHEMATDELTVFDKNGNFSSLYNCPAGANQIITNFLNRTMSKTNSYAFAFMNVSIYRDSAFNWQCNASGSVGNWTDTRSSSKRLFSAIENKKQYFGVAQIVVGE
ncbi:TPA: hypothetical protein HA244_02480 [Candidatus Micrarchaeota archaeon]|nr:hypothetical protein [Candidatus Micrarchaeota archaeon]